MPCGTEHSSEKTEKKSGRRGRNTEKVPNSFIYCIYHWLAGKKIDLFILITILKSATTWMLYWKAELPIGWAHRIAPCPTLKCLFLFISYLRARGAIPATSGKPILPRQRGERSAHAKYFCG